MAAAGGDTIVPTNWGGLILTAVIIAVVAAGTYFGMESMFGHQGGVEQKDELTVQEVFSASAKREVEAVEPARVLSRAELAASSSDDSSWNDDAATDMADAAASDDWDQAAADSDNDDWNSSDQDWDTSSSDDWDAEPAEPAAADDDMMAEASDAEPAEEMMEEVSAVASSAYESAKDMADEMVSSTKQAMNDARNALTAPSAPVRQRPSADALRDWWSAGSGDLAVRFAGTLDRGNRVSDGIAVMFSEPVSPQQANQHMMLSSADGNSVAAVWKTARNPNMLIVEGLSTGRYELMIKSSLAAESGTRLAQSVNGPVFVY